MSVTAIPQCEIHPHPFSYGDPNGRLFSWQGMLYRGIRPERAEFYRRLFETGVIGRLCDRGLLVPTVITDLALDGYAMVLRHDVIPFPSYVYEWCAEMLRDAALLIADLEIELADHNLTLQDGHPWNLLFHGPRPIYVDFGSLVPADPREPWHACDEYRRFLVHPLYLMANGYDRIARQLLQDPQGVLASDLSHYVRSRSISAGSAQAARLKLIRRMVAVVRHRVRGLARQRIRRWIDAASPLASRTPLAGYASRRHFVDRVRQEVQEINWQRTVRLAPGPGRCASRERPREPAGSPGAAGAEKERVLERLIRQLGPSSLLDISGSFRYASLAAQAASSAVVFDVDPTVVSRHYRQARDRALPLLPLVMDLLDSSPGRGVFNRDAIPAVERFRCELVLALERAHDLVHRNSLSLDQIAQVLSIFSLRWLLVEFDPPARTASPGGGAGSAPYTLDSFRASLGQVFRTITISWSDAEGRALLLCEK